MMGAIATHSVRFDLYTNKSVNEILIPNIWQKSALYAVTIDIGILIPSIM